jgi:plasmid stabilization system protein ParE
VIKIIFSNKAQTQLIDHAHFIYEQSKNADIADAYLDKMRDYIVDILTQFPKSGRPSEDIIENSRKLVYQGFSIIYCIEVTHIEVLTIYRENLS